MIPSIATAPALVMVGIFMIEPLMHVDLSDTKTAFPVFICVAFMAFTFNIAYGILFGLLAYTGGQVFAGNARKLPDFHLDTDRRVPTVSAFGNLF